jgi:hypothetical protein
MTSAHAVALRSLPAIHRDPFDRMLVAQAIVEGLTLVTSDPESPNIPGLSDWSDTRSRPASPALNSPNRGRRTRRATGSSRRPVGRW